MNNPHNSKANQNRIADTTNLSDDSLIKSSVKGMNKVIPGYQYGLNKRISPMNQVILDKTP